VGVPLSSWLGDYQVLELLGSGGMGEVYLVEERGTRARHAMKTLRSASPGSELWQRFMNEGRVMSGLQHPNIAGFREMFQCDDRLCLVMDYVDGETLFSYVRRKGTLPVEEALAVVAHLCAALAYLRERGVLHRDLKSANVKITSTGTVKLLDFGIAKVKRTPGMTAHGAVMGTPEYLSPEQVAGTPADGRSEIWGLGLLAYEMLTGRLPFDGPEETALFEAIRNAAPARPSALNPAVPAQVDALVMKCLEKRPSRRFQAAEELRDAVHEALAGGPATEPFGVWVQGWTERMRSAWRRLTPRVRLAVAAVVAVVVLLGIASMFSSGSGEYRSIVVDVVDGRADVYARGSRVGRTPYQLEARVGETVSLELRKSGFQDQPIQFEVTERKAYSYSMQPAH
jgi:eukaryotic-like serine/threonine-protein kinase